MEPESREISEQLHLFWELEAIGITDTNVTYDNSDREVLMQFENTLSFQNGRYEACFPWKPDLSKLPNNYTVAEKRLKQLRSRLECNEEQRQKYTAAMEENIAMGFAELVTYVIGNVSVKFDLPHQAVFRDDKRV